MGVSLLKKKTTGDWYVWIYYQGCRRAKKIGKNKALACRIAAEYQKRLLLGQDVWQASSRCTFEVFCEQYLSATENVLKYSTWIGYKHIIERHLLPAWRLRLLSNIVRNDVRQVLTSIGKQDLSTYNIRICISAIFQHAVERDLLPLNPARNLGKSFAMKHERQPIVVLTADEVAVLLQTAIQQSPKDYLFYFIAFRTGLRLGELLALRWSDIDLVAGKICISRSFTYGRFTTPKSHKIRYVDISTGLSECLKAHCPANDSFVFKQEIASGLRRRFYKLLSIAGLSRMRLHDIRHTFASLLLSSGAPIDYVRRQLGHSSIVTTVDLYGHQLANELRYVNNLDNHREST